MGEAADDAFDAAFRDAEINGDYEWGRRSRPWPVPRFSAAPRTSAVASDFDNLDAPAVDPFWTAAENYAQAYKEYYSYMCDASYADLQAAVEALEAAR